MKRSSKERSDDDLFLQIILASTDFDVFMQLMTETAREEKLKKEAGASNSKHGDDDEDSYESSAALPSSSSSKYSCDYDVVDDGDFI